MVVFFALLILALRLWEGVWKSAGVGGAVSFTSVAFKFSGYLSKIKETMII